MTTPTEDEGLRKALEQLDTRLAQIGGCSDGYCKVVRREGVHTNGGCRCLKDPLKADRVVGAYKTFRQALSTPEQPAARMGGED